MCATRATSRGLLGERHIRLRGKRDSCALRGSRFGEMGDIEGKHSAHEGCNKLLNIGAEGGKVGVCCKDHAQVDVVEQALHPPRRVEANALSLA